MYDVFACILGEGSFIFLKSQETNTIIIIDGQQSMSIIISIYKLPIIQA